MKALNVCPSNKAAAVSKTPAWCIQNHLNVLFTHSVCTYHDKCVMLRGATCLSHGRSVALRRGSLAGFARQHAILIDSWCKSTTLPTKHSRRTLSTPRDGTKEAQDSATPPAVHGNSLNSRSNKARKDLLDVKAKDNSEQTFVLTPRFQWRWRWNYPGTNRRGDRKPYKKDDASKEEAAPQEVGSGHFLPTRGEQEQKELQSVMDSLSKMSEELQPPLSPLEKAAEDKEWKPKRQPTKQEKQRLAYNPWAVMLAGKVRLDTGSRLRLPEPLLLPLGEVVNPADESVYLLPDDLANLEAYDERLRKGLRRVAMMDLPRENGGGTVNVLPYKLLLDELTEEMVVWDTSSKRGRTKTGTIAKRLLPTRWMERAQRVTAYQNASKDYWDLKEKMCETDDQDFKKPEKPFDVTQLQWQPNVAERMQSIMRQRLLLALDHLGRKVDEPRSRPRRHVMCFDWPKSLYLDVIKESSKTPAKSGQHGETNSTFSISAQHYKPEEVAKTSEDTGALKPVWSPNPSTYHFDDPDVWLPGSCFLHIGPPETTLTALLLSPQHTTSSTEQDLSQLSTNKFNPPILRVNNHLRLPIFNLPALLGPKFDHPLHQVLTRHGMIPSDTNSDSPDEKNYLILIRATAPGGHYVVRELWQLWRFLGGTDCLDPNAVSPSTGRPQTDTRIEKDRIKQYYMPKKVWDHLYKFLPGIERPPPNREVKSEDGKNEP